MKLLLALTPVHDGETFCSVCGPLDEPGTHNQPDCTRFQVAEQFVDAFCRMVNQYAAEGKVTTITLSPGEPAMELTGAWRDPACMCCADSNCECHGTDLA